MKSYILLGVVALLAMVMAMPAMAADTAVVVSGLIAEPPCEEVFTITAPGLVDFGTFTVGQNSIIAGDLTIDTVCDGAWTIDVAPTPDTGLMTDSVKEISLLSELQQMNQVPEYTGVTQWGIAGTGDMVFPLDYSQAIAAEDLPGTYSISLVYTITPV